MLWVKSSFFLFTIGGQCLFTKVILHEFLKEFVQKVIQKCTNHFGKDWTINKAEITHQSLYLLTLSRDMYVYKHCVMQICGKRKITPNL